jgi:hypothetical protein
VGGGQAHQRDPGSRKSETPLRCLPTSTLRQRGLVLPTTRAVATRMRAHPTQRSQRGLLRAAAPVDPGPAIGRVRSEAAEYELAPPPMVCTSGA